MLQLLYQLSITPSSASNKIFVVISIVGGGVTGVNIGFFRLVRDSTAIYVGNTAGSRTSSFATSIGL
jgi:hypothetical protein